MTADLLDDYTHRGLRVMRAIIEENSGEQDARIEAIKRRFIEAQTARDLRWVTSCSGPDYLIR
jgi:hypothetical protein